MPKAAFLGIAFPFQRSATSLPAAITDDDLIKQSLTQIILTGRGERVMRPTFGSNAYSYVFENNSLVFQETVRADVMASISKVETRVIVQSVDVTRDDVTAFIKIIYIVLSSQQQQTLKISIPIG
jgi:phage baseplate assembly protein W